MAAQQGKGEENKQLHKMKRTSLLIQCCYRRRASSAVRRHHGSLVSSSRSRQARSKLMGQRAIHDPSFVHCSRTDGIAASQSIKVYSCADPASVKAYNPSRAPVFDITWGQGGAKLYSGGLDRSVVEWASKPVSRLNLG